MDTFRFDFSIAREDRDTSGDELEEAFPSHAPLPHSSQAHTLAAAEERELDKQPRGRQEVNVSLFHRKLLQLCPPLQTSVHLRPPLDTSVHDESYRIELHYLVADQLQSLLSAGGINKSEQILNSNSDSKTCYSSEHNLTLNTQAVLAQLRMELGPLVGVVNSAHSDLIPGVYEGGMKVWECALDLVEHLVLGRAPVPIQGARVLDLGCGVGLPGITCLLLGADCVHFQDYNREVLSCLTIPSTIASLSHSHTSTLTPSHLSTASCVHIHTDKIDSDNTTSSLEPESDPAVGTLNNTRFFFGDWSEFASRHQHSGESPYDIILTSETIYSPSCQPRLLAALKVLADPCTAVVLLAAKTQYFGVGGSVGQFEEAVEKDGYFVVASKHCIPATVPRVIIELRIRTS